MIKEFEPVAEEVLRLVAEWEPKLLALPEELISVKRNKQGRTIRQIVGHMVDSASNNTHRMVHLQYRKCPLDFPNYATEGNNDRWIAIQNYQEEDWGILVMLWEYSNLHVVHVIKNINPGKLENEWIASPGNFIPLSEMVVDYLRHFKLHLGEIDEIINS